MIGPGIAKHANISMDQLKSFLRLVKIVYSQQ